MEHPDTAADFVAHSLKDGREETRFAGENYGADPVYSPDGRFIAFVSTRSGCMDLWLSRGGTSAAEQITQFRCRGMLMFPAWSPDGQSIAFSFREHGATNLFVYSLGTRSVRQITFTHKRG